MVRCALSGAAGTGGDALHARRGDGAGDDGGRSGAVDCRGALCHCAGTVHPSRRTLRHRHLYFQCRHEVRAPAFGTPEYMRATQMTGQMARYYDLPMRASGVCTANVRTGRRCGLRPVGGRRPRRVRQPGAVSPRPTAHLRTDRPDTGRPRDHARHLCADRHPRPQPRRRGALSPGGPGRPLPGTDRQQAEDQADLRRPAGRGRLGRIAVKSIRPAGHSHRFANRYGDRHQHFGGTRFSPKPRRRGAGPSGSDRAASTP